MEENNNVQEEMLQNEENTQNAENAETLQNVENKTHAEDLLQAEKDKYLRLFAEFENYKKRTAKEKIDFFKYANQALITALLPVVDDFERCITEISKTSDEQTIQGVQLIQHKLNNLLKDKGLQKIEVSSGDNFNVDLHEAITQIPAPEESLKEKIVDVVETGYQLQDKVIRFAKVVIGK